MPEKKYRARLIATLATLTLALTGCAELPKDAPISEVNYRACLETETDSDALGINEVADYSVKQAVVTYGVKRTVQKSSAKKFESNTSKLVKSGCNLIVLSGVGFSANVANVVASHPEVNFLYLTDRPESKLLAENLDNLAVYQIDVYEAGLLIGEIASSFSTDGRVASECLPPGRETLVAGIRAANPGFEISKTAPSYSTVRVLLGCPGDQTINLADYSVAKKLVSFGGDLYLNPAFADAKPYIAATVIPSIRPRILEVIASDLEGDFIGGRLGSNVALYGNGGLTISSEHEVVYPTNLLKRLEQVALEYEVTLK